MYHNIYIYYCIMYNFHIWCVLLVCVLDLQRGEVPAPLMVPEGAVFRPRKQEVEQLQERDFLGKAKVHDPFIRAQSALEIILCISAMLYKIPRS